MREAEWGRPRVGVRLWGGGDQRRGARISGAALESRRKCQLHEFPASNRCKNVKQ